MSFKGPSTLTTPTSLKSQNTDSLGSSPPRSPLSTVTSWTLLALPIPKCPQYIWVGGAKMKNYGGLSQGFWVVGWRWGLEKALLSGE